MALYSLFVKDTAINVVHTCTELYGAFLTKIPALQKDKHSYDSSVKKYPFEIEIVEIQFQLAVSVSALSPFGIFTSALSPPPTLSTVYTLNNNIGCTYYS